MAENKGSAAAGSFGSMDEVRKVFSKFDKNGDGRISSDELKDILKALGTTTSPEEVQCVMQELDKDGDGYIDFDEFVDFHLGGSGSGGDGSKELKDAFDLFDVDKNGVISVSELHSVLRKLGEKCSMSDCAKMIKKVDTDGDGHVNFEEFKMMMSRS